MKTRDEIFGIYLDFYSSDVKVRKISNPFYIPDEQSIFDSIQKTEDTYKQISLKLFFPTQSERLLSTKSNPFIRSIRKKAMLCLATMNMIINGMRTI